MHMSIVRVIFPRHLEILLFLFLGRQQSKMGSVAHVYRRRWLGI